MGGRGKGIPPRERAIASFESGRSQRIDFKGGNGEMTE